MVNMFIEIRSMQSGIKRLEETLNALALHFTITARIDYQSGENH